MKKILIFILLLCACFLVSCKNKVVDDEVKELAEIYDWQEYCYTYEETSEKGVYIVHIYVDHNTQLFVYMIKKNEHCCMLWE